MNLFYRLFFLFLIVGCKAQTYTIDTLPERRIEFGNYGGFTGAKTSYVILENGQVFQIKGDHQSEFKKIPKRQAKAIFKAADELLEKELNISETGNLTNFIQVNTGKQKQEWKWVNNSAKPSIGGNSPMIVPNDLDSFYSLLLGIFNP